MSKLTQEAREAMERHKAKQRQIAASRMPPREALRKMILPCCRVVVTGSLSTGPKKGQ